MLVVEDDAIECLPASDKPNHAYDNAEYDYEPPHRSVGKQNEKRTDDELREGKPGRIPVDDPQIALVIKNSKYLLLATYFIQVTPHDDGLWTGLRRDLT